VAPELEHLMSEELPLIRQHFDMQLNAIKALVETAQAQQSANHHQQMAIISEVKADVKIQNGRLIKVESDQAYAKGRSEGSRTSTNLIITILALVAGSGGTLVAVVMAGR
jgi:hypothetical protein